MAGFAVRVFPANIAENYPDDFAPHEIAPYLAEEKARAVHAQLRTMEVLLAADSIVVLDGLVLGKPTSKLNAIETLRKLSGKTHLVYTGVCLMSASTKKTFQAVTEVNFSDLSNAEIEYYVEKYNPMDKAGAYGIQEWLGWCKIKGISGSYSNVMGLPLEIVYEQLKEMDT
ncbi:UNVERIFIED_CONTAM: hypothetical protein GTU68_028348 [Idotea baltica]|nr:hypothetical protein [Idotea baltica]